MLQADLSLSWHRVVDYTIGAEYRRQQGVNGTGSLAGLFFSVPLPIFNRNQGEIARAGAEHQKAALTASSLDASVAAEVASAYQEFESARQLLADVERDLLQPASDARAGTIYVYQAGATSLLDVLDAQRAYNDTMDTYYSAQAAYRRAEARLGLVTGVDLKGRPDRLHSVRLVHLIVLTIPLMAGCRAVGPAAKRRRAPPVARDPAPASRRSTRRVARVQITIGRCRHARPET